MTFIKRLLTLLCRLWHHQSCYIPSFSKRLDPFHSFFDWFCFYRPDHIQSAYSIPPPPLLAGRESHCIIWRSLRFDTCCFIYIYSFLHNPFFFGAFVFSFISFQKTLRRGFYFYYLQCLPYHHHKNNSNRPSFCGCLLQGIRLLQTRVVLSLRVAKMAVLYSKFLSFFKN